MDPTQGCFSIAGLKTMMTLLILFEIRSGHWKNMPEVLKGGASGSLIPVMPAVVLPTTKIIILEC